jgi:hypothetical protein
VLDVLGYLVFFVLLGLAWRLRKRRRHIGPAAAGTMYEMLNDERRKALEIIVEEKAGARDGEPADDVPEQMR